MAEGKGKGCQARGGRGSVWGMVSICFMVVAAGLRHFSEYLHFSPVDSENLSKDCDICSKPPRGFARRGSGVDVDEERGDS